MEQFDNPPGSPTEGTPATPPPSPPVGPPPVARPVARTGEVPPAVKWTAIYWYVTAGLLALFGLGMFTLIPIILAASAGDSAEGAAAGSAVFGVLGFVMIAFAVLYAFLGMSLMKLRNWARVVSIVFAALGLLSFPIGTIIGVLILINLTKPEIKDLFA